MMMRILTTATHLDIMSSWKVKRCFCLILVIRELHYISLPCTLLLSLCLALRRPVGQQRALFNLGILHRGVWTGWQNKSSWKYWLSNVKQWGSLTKYWFFITNIKLKEHLKICLAWFLDIVLHCSCYCIVKPSYFLNHKIHNSLLHSAKKVPGHLFRFK